VPLKHTRAIVPPREDGPHPPAPPPPPAPLVPTGPRRIRIEREDGRGT
jgi:hypothetical protein